MTAEKNRFLFGAVVGSGMTAQVADRAKADYLLVLNAGRFRVQGATSLACFLPIRNANDWVFEFAEREILGRVQAPLFAGLSVADPTLDLDAVVKRTRDLGFKGVCNFPSNALVGGRIRKLIESEGIGYDREVALVEHARAAGLEALVYVAENDQARRMYDAGATTVCVNMGFTSGPTGVDSELNVASAAQFIDQVLDGLPATMPTLCAGGPIISPEDALAVWRSSKVQGYISGSSLDRLPIEQTLEDVASGFRMISQLSTNVQERQDYSTRLTGSSAQIQSLNRDILEFADEETPVLVLGETGTGKTKVARLLHQLSNRKRQTLSVIDCPGLELETGRVQLMGVAAGASKGGVARSRGALEAAARGTVIFDAVDGLSPEHQGQILRFAEDGTVQRLGDIESRSISARIVSTASPRLQEMLDANTFRRDLYYRLAVQEIHIPALRDHIEDLPELADSIVAQLTGNGDVGISNSALKILMDYAWPGNVRELQNVLTRALRRSNRHTINRRDLDLPVPMNGSAQQHVPEAEPEQMLMPRSERDWVAHALAQHGWRRAEAAKELGMSTRTLFNKIKKYGLDT